MSKKREVVRWVIVGGGAGSCLLVALFGIVRIFYWHQVTGDWFDDHILYWQPIGIACLGGVFIFTRLVDSFFA